MFLTSQMINSYAYIVVHKLMIKFSVGASLCSLWNYVCQKIKTKCYTMCDKDMMESHQS